jgi:hypothetical protein
VRRIALENLDESLIQLINSLASFLIQLDLCARGPDELVALPVNDFEGQSPLGSLDPETPRPAGINVANQTIAPKTPVKGQ